MRIWFKNIINIFIWLFVIDIYGCSIWLDFDKALITAEILDNFIQGGVVFVPMYLSFGQVIGHLEYFFNILSTPLYILLPIYVLKLMMLDCVTWVC